MIDSEDFMQYVADYVRRTRKKSRSSRLAVIDWRFDPAGFKNGQNPRIIFDGEKEPTKKRYPVLSPYWPQPGDRVLVQPVGKNHYVIMGGIERHRVPTLEGSLLPGNMATGIINITPSSGTAQEVVEYGPLTGTGDTRVFCTFDSSSTQNNHTYAHSITESQATIRIVTESSTFPRDVQWLAIRGMG